MLGDPSSVPTLLCVAVGGEALPHNLMQQWMRSSCRLLVTYGVTEVTVYQTIHDVAAEGELHSVKGSLIGSALQGVGAAVVDSGEVLVARGQPGQIVLFGSQLAFGYVGQEDGVDAGGFRLLNLGEGIGRVPAYFTGDGGTMLSDGQLLFHGRLDCF
jgi:acyl-coenzyme A synthetase/AMP-(fatty) acid ligase